MNRRLTTRALPDLRRQRKTVRNRDNLWDHLFISPQLVGLLVFTLFPVLMSLYLCFMSWNFIDAPSFVGLANFRAVFGNELFYTSLFNTLMLVAGIVPLTTIASLLLALMTLRLAWFINDRKVGGQRSTLTFTFKEAGSYEVTVAATNAAGEADTDSGVIEVSDEETMTLEEL
jgi:ABC-type spermidine/putrescine transport system permease subunit I